MPEAMTTPTLPKMPPPPLLSKGKTSQIHPLTPVLLTSTKQSTSISMVIPTVKLSTFFTNIRFTPGRTEIVDTTPEALSMLHLACRLTRPVTRLVDPINRAGLRPKPRSPPTNN